MKSLVISIQQSTLNIDWKTGETLKRYRIIKFNYKISQTKKFKFKASLWPTQLSVQGKNQKYKSK